MVRVVTSVKLIVREMNQLLSNTQKYQEGCK